MISIQNLSISSSVRIALSAALLCFTTLALTSCKSKMKHDPKKTYTELTADAITAIHVDHAITVRFTQKEGATPTITTVCRNEYAHLIDVHMDGSVLVATYKNLQGTILDSGVEVYVEAPSVGEIVTDMAATVNLGEELKLNGDLRISCDHAGNVKCKKITCNNLILNVTNASVIQLNAITANDVSARATNSGRMYLEGTTNTSTIQQVFEQQIRVDRLKTQNGHVEFVKDTPLPVLPKKDAPAKPQPSDTAKATSAPAAPAASSAPAAKPTVATDTTKTRP